MRKFTAALIIFASMTALSYPAWAQTGTRPEDEAAIRKIVSRLEGGWNAGDGKAFAAPFAPDADYVVVNGLRIKGRDMIDAGHQNIFNTFYKNSAITPTILSIRFIRDDVALAHVQWHLKFSENGAARESKAINTLVLTKDGGQWSISAFHNTPIQGTQK
ncbi:MAG TPA: SgcJ/EcaC family oxidoreductase [Blastocatellia bacterium]|nr:SgcJ/EcaC family oxidoreductase [Blastocatellia bacterium]